MVSCDDKLKLSYPHHNRWFQSPKEDKLDDQIIHNILIACIGYNVIHTFTHSSAYMWRILAVDILYSY